MKFLKLIFLSMVLSANVFANELFQVRIFESGSLNRLESEINSFLRRSNATAVNISMSSYFVQMGGSTYQAIVMYKKN